MDQETLVDKLTEDGARLLDRLKASGLDVAAAGWVKREEDIKWYLYIVPPAAEGGMRDGYRVVQSALLGMPDTWITLMDVRLLPAAHPLARALLEVNGRYPGSIPLRFGRSDLGSVVIDGAYIYPPSLFQPQPQAG